MLNIKNFKIALKNPNKIPGKINYILKERQSLQNIKNIQKKILKKNIIWHFATPKSASTYLITILSKNSTYTVSSIPYHDNRPQISDFNFLLDQIKKYKFYKKKPFLVLRQHTFFHDDLNKYISKNHKIIIQTRNIYESILSLKDYTISNNFYKNPFLDFYHTGQNDKETLKSFIYSYVPFHIRFLSSWVNCETEGKKIFINYKDFVSNPENSLYEIIGQKIDKENFDINKLNHKKIKYNIGTSRINNLNSDERHLIDDIVNHLTKGLNPKIKSLIYE